MQAVLDYKWSSYGRGLFLLLGVFSVLLALSFSAYTYYGQQLVGWRLVAWTVALGLNLLPLVLQEVVQVGMMLREGKGPATYLGNPWNAADALTYMGLVAVMALRWLLPRDTTGAYIVAAGVSLLLWLKLLYYFRGAIVRLAGALLSCSL